jgi:hypothetical protein
MGIVDGVVEGGSERACCDWDWNCGCSICCCAADADAGLNVEAAVDAVVDILLTLEALAERCAIGLAGWMNADFLCDDEVFIVKDLGEADERDVRPAS